MDRVSEPDPPPINNHSGPACGTCKKRRVKCNRQTPCDQCIKQHSECVYPVEVKRRPRGPGKRLSAEREREMLVRVQKLEALLSSAQKMTKEKDDDSDDYALNKGNERNPKQDSTRMLVRQGHSIYLDDNFWASVTDEIGDLREALDISAYRERTDSAAERSSGLALGVNPTYEDLRSYHPPIVEVMKYWQLYLRNVHLIFHILHKGTIERIINKRMQYPHLNLPASDEALFFAIYLVVITSMNHEEVFSTFNTPRAELIALYKRALEQAFLRAHLIKTTEIRTLQAFSLFLVCIRRYEESRVVWSLVGLALRLAMSIGLHRDGESHGLNPFVVEERRRLWWELYMFEIRASDDQGIESSLTSFDTKPPLNINDEDLDIENPEKQEPLKGRPGFSDSSVIVARSQIVRARTELMRLCRKAQHHDQVAKLEERVKIVSQCEEYIYSSLLQDPVPDEALLSLKLFLTQFSKMNLAKLLAMALNPRFGQIDDLSTQINQVITDFARKSTIVRPGTTASNASEFLFELNISILETNQEPNKNPLVRHYAWAGHRYFQWQQMAYVLSQLCESSNGILLRRAWQTVEEILSFDDPVTLSDERNSIMWQPILRLLDKALKIRAKIDPTFQATNTPDSWVARFPIISAGRASIQGYDNNYPQPTTNRQHLPATLSPIPESNTNAEWPQHEGAQWFLPAEQGNDFDFNDSAFGFPFL